jgi:hypothetical protein
MGKTFVDDLGTVILIDMDADISSATDISLIVIKPDGTKTTFTPTVYETKYLKYTTVSGDLNMAGKYAVQPHLTLGGWTGSGEETYFNVYKKNQ